MSTAPELVYRAQMEDLESIAIARSWQIQEIDDCSFQLAFPTHYNSLCYLFVECDDFPSLPPAWHWCDKNGDKLNEPVNTPKGSGGYFHGSGRICAPWNRLSYRSVDAKGPHKDWTLSNWITNPKTGACNTLAAMALRIAVELRSPRFQGRAA